MTVFHTKISSSHRIILNYLKLSHDFKFGLGSLKPFVMKSNKKSIASWWGSHFGRFTMTNKICLLGWKDQHNLTKPATVNFLIYISAVGPNDYVAPPTKFQWSSPRTQFDIGLGNLVGKCIMSRQTAMTWTQQEVSQFEYTVPFCTFLAFSTYSV